MKTIKRLFVLKTTLSISIGLLTISANANERNHNINQVINNEVEFKKDNQIIDTFDVPVNEDKEVLIYPDGSVEQIKKLSTTVYFERQTDNYYPTI